MFRSDIYSSNISILSEHEMKRKGSELFAIIGDTLISIEYGYKLQCLEKSCVWCIYYATESVEVMLFRQTGICTKENNGWWDQKRHKCVGVLKNGTKHHFFPSLYPNLLIIYEVDEKGSETCGAVLKLCYLLLFTCISLT